VGQEFALKLLFDQSQEAETGIEDASDESLRLRLQFHIDCTGHSPLDICHKIGGGMRAPHIFSFLIGEPTECLAIVRRDVATYLRENEDPGLPLENPMFCQTSIAARMEGVCNCCKQDSDMGIIIGASGLGKTEFLKEMKRRDREMIVVTGDPTARSMGAILLLLSKPLPGVYNRACTNTAFMMNIIDHLRGSGRLLVIDESHFLSWESFELLRKIYDSTGIGLVFVGQQRMYDEMRGGSRKSLLWDQIFSRVGIRCHFKNDIQMEDVEMIANRFYPAGLCKKSMEYLHSKASGPGKFRALVKLLQRAQRLAEAENTKVTLPLLQQVNKLLMA
jgi:hypothetical protein